MAYKCSLLFLAVASFLLSVPRLDQWPRKSASPEMEVVLPKLVQVVMAGGDRYLAANFGGIRALVADTQRLDRAGFQTLARVQEDVAWLNPAHEDNYYIGAAILPWNGQLEAGQYILRRAAEARPFDMWPAFYYAFDLYHFKKDALGAAEWLRFAATRTGEERESLLLNDLASRWVRRRADHRDALGVIRAMAQSTHSAGFAAHLRKHVARLENLMAIEEEAQRYRERDGQAPRDLAALQREAPGLRRLVDPFGGTYVLDGEGKASVRERQ